MTLPTNVKSVVKFSVTLLLRETLEPIFQCIHGHTQIQMHTNTVLKVQELLGLHFLLYFRPPV